jgi:hypothetical protein
MDVETSIIDELGLEDKIKIIWTKETKSIIIKIKISKKIISIIKKTKTINRLNNVKIWLKIILIIKKKNLIWL